MMINRDGDTFDIFRNNDYVFKTNKHLSSSSSSYGQLCLCSAGRRVHCAVPIEPAICRNTLASWQWACLSYNVHSIMRPSAACEICHPQQAVSSCHLPSDCVCVRERERESMYICGTHSEGCHRETHLSVFAARNKDFLHVHLQRCAAYRWSV